MLLRGNAPLSRDIRDTLADLIAMDDEPRWRPRKIEFGFRREGKRHDRHFESAIAAIVEKHRIDGGTVTDGIEAAIVKFNLDGSTVRRYWGRYTKAMEAMGFKITKPGRKSKKQT